MNKYSKFMMVILALVIVFSLTACNGSESGGGSKDKKETADTVSGIFVLTAMVEGTEEYSPEVLEGIGAKDFFVEFNDDKTFTFSISGEKLEGTYVKDGSTLTLTAEGDEEALIGTIDGDNFILEDEVEGTKMTFTRE